MSEKAEAFGFAGDWQTSVSVKDIPTLGVIGIFVVDKVAVANAVRICWVDSGFPDSEARNSVTVI